MDAKLIFEDKTEFYGKSFGDNVSAAGEIVFTTGMVGYPESMTDPSYKGQIVVFTYPILGNYGIASQDYWESASIQTSGIVVSQYVDTPSHFLSQLSLGDWLKKEKIPGIEIADTRAVTQKLREKGTMLGKIVIKNNIKLYDPNKDNLVAQVSTKKIISLGNGKKTVLLFDCGSKKNIAVSLAKRGVKVRIVPWDYDPFVTGETFDAAVISNGPGDPKMAEKTIVVIRKLLEKKIPTFGICLGHQLLALAAGGDTRKLKYGHRSQNQPAILEGPPRIAGEAGTKRCYITTQNHGFEVYKIPSGFKKWFTNANDGSNEGIIHKNLPFMSVQFHPEATPGPTDCDFLFDYFLDKI